MFPVRAEGEVSVGGEQDAPKPWEGAGGSESVDALMLAAQAEAAVGDAGDRGGPGSVVDTA